MNHYVLTIIGFLFSVKITPFVVLPLAFINKDLAVITYGVTLTYLLTHFLLRTILVGYFTLKEIFYTKKKSVSL